GITGALTGGVPAFRLQLRKDFPRSLPPRLAPFPGSLTACVPRTRFHHRFCIRLWVLCHKKDEKSIKQITSFPRSSMGTQGRGAPAPAWISNGHLAAERQEKGPHG